jgi:hypothetical protein
VVSSGAQDGHDAYSRLHANFGKVERELHRLVSVEADREMSCATERTAMNVERTLDDMEANSVFHFLAHLLTSSLASYSRIPNLGGCVGVDWSLWALSELELGSLMLDGARCRCRWFAVENVAEDKSVFQFARF